jgi:hypothetical protein
MGNGNKIQVKGKGTVMLEVAIGKYKTLGDVQYASELGYNLLSVGQLMTAGNSVVKIGLGDRLGAP